MKSHDIRSLANHDFGLLDSFAKSTKSSLPNPLGQIHLAKSSLPDTFKMAISPQTRRHSCCARLRLDLPVGYDAASAALRTNGVVRARWRLAETGMPLTVAEKRLEPCDGFNAA